MRSDNRISSAYLRYNFSHPVGMAKSKFADFHATLSLIIACNKSDCKKKKFAKITFNYVNYIAT